MLLALTSKVHCSASAVTIVSAALVSAFSHGSGQDTENEAKFEIIRLLVANGANASIANDAG